MAKLALQLFLNIFTIVILDLGLMGLALSSLISSVIISVVLTIFTIHHTGFRLDKVIAVKILKFSWPLWMSGLIGLYIGSSNRYFIRIFSSLDDVGLFELAAKFGAIVGVLVWSPFSQYWQTERFAIAKTTNPYPAYSLAFRMITALLLISGIWVNAFTPIAITLMSAPPFHPAMTAVPFLVVAAVYQCLIFFNNFSFLYMNRTIELTKNNLFAASIITLFYLALIPQFGFIGASIALAVSYVAQYSYALHVANKFYPLKIKQWSLIGATIVLLASCSVDYIFLEQGLFVNTVILKTSIAAVGSLMILLIIFGKDELLESKHYLYSIFKKR